MACGKLGQGSVVWACVHVLKDVSVITWPTAHKTEKQTGAVYTMGHSQGYTQRGYMFIHCESRGTWACVSVYWSSALKSWLCLWKIVSIKERSCSSNVVSWPEEKHICLYVLLWKWSCVKWLCAAMFARGVSPHIVLSLIPVGSVNTITRKNFT